MIGSRFAAGSRRLWSARACPALVLTATAFLPQRILTLMIPDPYGSSMPPDVNALFDAEGLPVGVTFERSGESVRFDDGVMQLEHTF